MLLHGLYKEVGVPGSLLDHPTGHSFTLQSRYGEGAVHTHHGFLVPLGDGYSVRHEANLVAELEDGRTIYVDILGSHESVERAKALGFDALRLKNSGRRKFHGALVYVRFRHAGMPQEQVEAIAEGYDYVFGISTDDTRLFLKYAALKSELVKWLRSGDE